MLCKIKVPILLIELSMNNLHAYADFDTLNFRDLFWISVNRLSEDSANCYYLLYRDF